MSNAEIEEKALIRKFFNNQKEGFFIEVGANDPKGGSQTWHLEELGWKGILIEPLKRCYQLLQKERPQSHTFNVACSSPEKTGKGYLYIPKNMDGFATIEKNVDDLGIIYDDKEEIEIVTLTSLIEKVKPHGIDFLSIDVEGTELDVLRGLDFSRHHPKLILIEDKLHNLAKHRYLQLVGYKLVKRTALNNWYIPKEIPFKMTSFGEKLKLFRKVFLGLPFRKWHRSHKLKKQSKMI